ncbi:MAG: hypothetical protein ABUJ92_16200 [Desulfobacterales bacterium]
MNESREPQTLLLPEKACDKPPFDKMFRGSCHNLEPSTLSDTSHHTPSWHKLIPCPTAKRVTEALGIDFQKNLSKGIVS